MYNLNLKYVFIGISSIISLTLFCFYCPRILKNESILAQENEVELFFRRIDIKQIKEFNKNGYLSISPGDVNNNQTRLNKIVKRWNIDTSTSAYKYLIEKEGNQTIHVRAIPKINNLSSFTSTISYSSQIICKSDDFKADLIDLPKLVNEVYSCPENSKQVKYAYPYNL